MESLGLLNSLSLTRGTVDIKKPMINEEMCFKSDEALIKQAAHETHSFLGDSGLKVSKLCLGSFVFGELDKKFGSRPGQLSEGEAHKILDRYLELGGNFIDTGDYFPWLGSCVGESEKIIGNWLSKKPRNKVIVSTRVGWPLDLTNVNSVGLSRTHIMNSVERSLKNLKTDYIDLLQISRWDEVTDINDTMRTLNDLVRSGKVRHIGCCDLCGWQIQWCLDIAKTYNMERFITLNTEYNILTRGPEMELIPTCKNKHLSLLPYSPLKGGYLTNKFTKNMTKPQEGTRIAAATADKSNDAAFAVPFDEMKSNEQFWRCMDVCEKIAQKHKKTVAQVALRWLIQKDVVCSVMMSCKSIEQLEENMGAMTFNLNLEDIMELDTVSATPLPSPYYLKHTIYMGRSRSFYTTKDLSQGAVLQDPLIKGMTKHGFHVTPQQKMKHGEKTV